MGVEVDRRDGGKEEVKGGENGEIESGMREGVYAG